jgi:cytochrome c peroxidase
MRMTKQSLRRIVSMSLVFSGAMLAAGTVDLRAQGLGPPQGVHSDGQLASLKFFPPPLPDLGGIVTSDWAFVLGKALFWDTDVGSDGQACASCHFHGGADPRVTNQISPGLKSVPSDTTFQRTASGAGGPNYTLNGKDFPFHKLADPSDQNSAVLFDTNDTAASAGTFGGNFVAVAKTLDHAEKCTTRPFDEFHIAAAGEDRRSLLTRKVEPRNTPSVINAVFNIRQFWDGRANMDFNGVNPFGPRDASARLVVFNPTTGTSALQPFMLFGASLASQAVGPALSDFEMSCSNRSFADLGRKLSLRTPLDDQVIDATDSMFGQFAEFGDLRAVNARTGVGRGLDPKYSYINLIKKSFDPRYWADTRKWRVVNGNLVADPVNGYTQLELNFSMFWGISIMLYEATLISDDSPFDRFMDNGALNPLPGFGATEIRGLGVFSNEGGCIHCHTGPVLSGPAVGINHLAEDNQIERMPTLDGGIALYDNGFYNIGVRPTRDDPGLGGIDPFGNSFSFTRQFLVSPFFPRPDNYQVDPCQWIVPFPNCGVLPDNFGPLTQRVAVDGAFKMPTLRNVGLTPPYFHNGGQGTLAQVVQFYSRGGDRRPVSGGDTSGSGSIGEDPLTAPASGSNVHPEIFNRNLTPQQRSDLVAFLKSLTDDRVRCHAAPFDHPELKVGNGANPNPALAINGKAADIVLTVAATGQTGLPTAKCAKMPNDGNVDQLAPSILLLKK